MTITATTTITVTTVGDGENSTDTYSFTNTTGVPPQQVGLTSSSNVTVPVPVNAAGFLLVTPTGVPVTIKGVAGDGGAQVNGGQFGVVFFDVAVPLNIVLQQTSGSFQLVLLVWL